MISCALIALMPEEGMDEVVQSLKDIFEFRLPVVQPILPEKTIEQPLQGKLMRTLNRPEIVIVE
jgi:hypothetical protein